MCANRIVKSPCRATRGRRRTALARLVVLALASLPAACVSPQDSLAGADSFWSSPSLRAASLNRAVVAQSALYPFHFEEGSDQLSPLGRRDLAVMAWHLRQFPGTLHLRRGGVSEALWQARAQQVREALAKAGVPEGNLALDDGPAGGPGMSGERSLRALQAVDSAAALPIAQASTPGEGS